LEKEIDTFKSCLKISKDENNLLTESINQMNNHFEKVENDIIEKNNEIETFKLKLEEQFFSLVQENSQNSNLVINIKNLNSELIILNQNLENENKKLKTNLGNIEIGYKELKDENNSLKSEMMVLKNKLNDCETDNHNLASINNTYKQKLNSYVLNIINDFDLNFQTR